MVFMVSMIRAIEFIVVLVDVCHSNLVIQKPLLDYQYVKTTPIFRSWLKKFLVVKVSLILLVLGKLRQRPYFFDHGFNFLIQQ